jgi:hypothetical protein
VLEGTYMCKAVSDIGMAITKAKLQIFNKGEKIKKQTAKQVKEKVKKEKVITREEETIEQETAEQVIEELQESPTVTDIQPIDETVTLKKVKEKKAKVIVSEAEHVETTDVVSFKKVDKKVKPKPKTEKGEPVITPHDYLISSQPDKKNKKE